MGYHEHNMAYTNLYIPAHARRVSTAAEMREFDRRAIEDFGIPGIVLMENAGRNVADVVRGLIQGSNAPHVTVVAGRGNNGGDGFVVARQLRDAGARVSVYLLGAPAVVKGDARVNLDILTRTGLPVRHLESLEDLRSSLAHCSVIVDAIFGTGLKDNVTGAAADAIDIMNKSGKPIVAIDIPSGLDSDTGQILGVCVRASHTVTFALPKIGHLTYPGAECVGSLIVGDIGIPHQLYDDLQIEITSPEWVASRLPVRGADSNKGTFGTTVVIAGSRGMTGAATMASESVLRAGAGLSFLALPESLQEAMMVKLTEVITRGLPDSDGVLTQDAVEPALDLSGRARSIVLGCGLGFHDETCEFVARFVSKCRIPIVVDADGLNCLSTQPACLQGEHGDMVITPHPGEMSRLLGTSIAQVQSDRIGAVREAASRFRCVAVLKGARTLICDPIGRVFINTTGNPGMATGGTGDVLAGTIGGLVAQGMSPFDAAACGVYVHGVAGDMAAEIDGTAGMLAGDLMRMLPRAISDVKRRGCC